MTYLFFDTETTGLPDFKADLAAPHQPRITQLAAILTDEAGNTLEEMCAYIKPDGWTVPEVITELNGTTIEKLDAEGIPMPEALARFNEMKAKCKCRIAHNISFDKQMLAREALAYGIAHDSGGLQSFCTMKESKEILKLPPSDKMMGAGIRGFKPPKLQEAYNHFFGKNFDGAHDAMADVRACKDVFFAIHRVKEAAAKDHPAILGGKTNRD